MDHHELEEGSVVSLDFLKIRAVATSRDGDVLPVVVQDEASREILMVGYTNQQAFEETLKRGRVVLWSTSRNELWDKGATSGNALEIRDIRVNCEQNSLLYLVRRVGEGACHTRNPDGSYRTGCFYRRYRDGRWEKL